MAVLQQTRYSEFVSGTVEAFVITNFMLSATIPAELPHLNVFVLTINDRLDPKQDTLARVARISDLSDLPIGRNDALLETPLGTGIEFLSQTVVASYPTLDEATAAQQAFVDMVNALVTSWVTFEASFNAPYPTPALITLPTSDPSQKQTLIAAYKAAKQARYAAQQTKIQTAENLTNAQASYTGANATLTSVQTLLTQFSNAVPGVGQLGSALATLISSGQTMYSAAVGTLPTPSAVFLTALQAAQTAYNNGTTTTSAMASFGAAMGTLVTTTLTPAVATAQAALTAAQAADIAQAQTVASALATETATLNALLAVAPDFPPTIVCQVPG